MNMDLKDLVILDAENQNFLPWILITMHKVWFARCPSIEWSDLLNKL